MEAPSSLRKALSNFTIFNPVLCALSRNVVKPFFANTIRAVETPTEGIPQAMEYDGVGEASAVRRLSIETSRNTLLYPKEKAQGKATICRALLPGETV